MRYIYCILFILFIISCNSSKKETTKKNITPEVTTIAVKKVTNSISEVLSPEARILIKDWREYKNIEVAINEYYSITTKEATLKAHELVKLTKQLRDSIRIEELKRPDVKTRLNVLYNNTMRLSDMDSIPKITAKEIENEINSTLQTFSSINSKINNIISTKNLEKELEDFKINN